MKAFLLAAGFGSRLRPLTDTTPKCLISVCGHPMLDWWAKLLSECGVTEILVNTHYLREKVHDYIIDFNENNKGAGSKIKFIEFYEPKLLGSGGTVRANRGFVKDEKSFLICYADNLCNVNLKKLTAFHEENGAPLTMALFRSNAPKQCGIAATDASGRIMQFEEKPLHPAGNLANAGIYVADNRIFDYFPDEEFIDFGQDVLPKLTGLMYGWETEDYLIDIGT
ncbi:MAG: nucleotidyltransferase family protein, partial [Lachnospiraceae bacterium]|nr:nucleotidyltransferase family protein [Lachnospiraceae bacterium]